MKDTTGFRDALVAALLCLLASFLLQLLFAGVAPWFATLALQLVILGIPFLFRYAPNYEDRGLLKASPVKDILLAVILTVFLAPCITLLGSLSGLVLPGYEDYIMRMNRLLLPGGLGLPEAGVFLLLALLPAFTEEYLFRGLILGRLRRSFTGLRPAVIGSAALFALIHLDPFRALPLFVYGMVLALLTLTTGRLWPAVASHLTNNLLALLALRLLPLDPAKGLPVEPSLLAVVLILVPTLLAVAILVRLVRRHRA